MITLTISCYGCFTTITIELPVRLVRFIHQCVPSMTYKSIAIVYYKTYHVATKSNKMSQVITE